MKSSVDISSKETRILLMLRKGYSNEEISLKLGRSKNTVKYHLKKIYKKLRAGNRIEAINKYYESIQIKP